MTGAILDIGILIGIRYTQFNGFYFCTEQCIFARTIIIVRIWRKIFIDILDQRVNSSYLFQLLCLSKFFYLFFIFTCVFNISYFYAKIDSQGSLVYPLKLSSGICPAATEFIFIPGLVFSIASLAFILSSRRSFTVLVCFDDEIS